jgi:hypothetical protein
MKAEWEGPHPDEGTLHAWLDGALDAPDALRVETHVAGCAPCRAAVAEARGLIAGASRIVGKLDDRPSPLVQPASTPTVGGSGSLWRLLRVTPARAALAAALVVAVGLTLTRNRAAVESTASSSASVAATPTPAAPPQQDRLLDSAVARRVAAEHPARVIERTPGVAVDVPPLVTAPPSAVPDPQAASRVASARASLREQRESIGAPADRARVGYAPSATNAPSASDRAVAAAKAAESAPASSPATSVLGDVTDASLAGKCFRVVSVNAPNAGFGPVTLPIILAFDGGNVARVLTAAGEETDSRAAWTRTGDDSLLIRLRRIGYSGTLTLGSGQPRTGLMQSGAIESNLNEVVVTGATQALSSAKRVAVKPDSAKVAAPRRLAPSPAATEARRPNVQVTSTPVACPTAR